MTVASDLVSWIKQPGVLTLDALRRVQLELATIAVPLPGRVEVDLSAATGRILSDPVLDLFGDAPGAPALAAGSRLEPRHLPVLAEGGRRRVTVVPRARVAVIALADEAPPGHAIPRRGGALASAAWVASAVQSLGADCLEAVCHGAGGPPFAQLLERLADDCDLVLVVGFLSPAQCEAVKREQQRRGLEQGVETLRLRPIGALQLTSLGSTLGLCVSADLESCVGTFTTLVTPLIRRLQGRHDVIPAVLAAALAERARVEEQHWSLFPVRLKTAVPAAGLALESCRARDAAWTLASADGLAWHAAEFGRSELATVGYFGFDAWLR